MHFIGIFANHSEFESIKQKVIEIVKRKDLEILNINSKNIYNMKNIIFETIVLCGQMHIPEMYKDIVEKICNNCKYILIHSDICTCTGIKANKKINCITYGLNQKSTITISSIQEEKAIIYIQRNIKNIEGKEIEMGEVSMYLPKKQIKIESLLAIFSIFLIYSQQID